MEQSEYDTLLAFCCDCKYPPECSKNEKDCIRRRAKNFIVKEGLLFYRDKHNKEYRVVTKKEKMKVLDGCHSAELGGGHFGRDKTLLKISERFYWIGMVNDVKEYCKTCEKCQKANGKFDKFSAELHPIPVKDEEWHTIGVDLIGPLPETQKGNKYIMTVSCLFSKWPEATALPDKTATGVAEFLFLCSQHMAVVNDELCRLCGIQCNMTSAYHPQSNGLDESERCDKPEDGLQQTITECNIKTMVDVRKKALENIMKAQGRQKNSKKLSKKGSKMEPNWTGPYLIHEVLSKGTYRLSKPNPPFQVLAQKYNMTRLKIFYQKVQVDVGVEDEEQQTSNVQDQVDADDVDKQREETILPSLQKSLPLHTLKSVDNEDSTIQLGNISTDDTCKSVLEDPNGWLDDEHITAAQHLLQEQHPDVAGLQTLASGNIEELVPFMGMKDNLSDLFSEDGVEHAVVSEDHSSSGLGCIERYLKVTHADLIAELHHPEKKKASVRDSYKANPEKKKASVRDSYNADIESKQFAKRQRYQEDVEENRAAKRQKYEDNSDAIKASERNRYWNDPAVRLAKRAAERKRFRMGHRTTTTTQSSSAPTSSSSRAAPTATSSSSRAAPTATSSSSRGRSIATCTSPTTGTSSIDTSAPPPLRLLLPCRCHHHPHGSHGQNQAAAAIEEAGGDIEDKAEQ
eukprot:Em0004g740a